jgi:hypothetical protein
LPFLLVPLIILIRNKKEAMDGDVVETEYEEIIN